ncbi:IclR family transcriptional regulator [Mycolicibacterium parafortuitum]|uniref:Glycerol operon regulatory protein n=1 Tax=Mycolicibacterium parafortuitum TaxID=39692 RepID=A0A375YNB8_MYCPF|nr:IclR family transcriptional regulator [Mycolicibacterium parafortuitum]ORB29114.1 IclR family transcriptional regulator [Mycolicibacterium parafortuitum]SRX82636.1 regulatory proteins IclR [Nocardia brasiliensis ATCC] [Mycolicibacterium parafortuitum]
MPAHLDTSSPDQPAAVQSVDRALLVLEIVAQLGQAGVTEIAAELGVHKSTVSRLVAVLESRGYVEQVSERGKYRLGFAIPRLAHVAGGQNDLVKLGQAACDMLSVSVGETANLAVLDQDRIVNIVEAIGPAEITLRTWVGQSCPAHATSSGKVLLAGLDPNDVRARLTTPLPSFTEATVTDMAGLQTQLAAVRERGWASVSEELEVGLNAVAAPVHDLHSQVVAALSVSGPSYRLSVDRFDEVAGQIVEAADQISTRLGWRGRH